VAFYLLGKANTSSTTLVLTKFYFWHAKIVMHIFIYFFVVVLCIYKLSTIYYLLRMKSLTGSVPVLERKEAHATTNQKLVMP